MNAPLSFLVYGQAVSLAEMIEANDEEFASWATTAQPGDWFNEACVAVAA